MKDNPCYQINRGVNSFATPTDNLRLEVSAACFHVLSYHHMDSAKFESAKDRDTLTLSFYHHQARIEGRNLRELAVAIQGRTVEFIKIIPNRYGGVAGNETGFVESIEVETIKAE
jgi:hypothetical protein